MVKELRDKTDAGMMDCKKALEETGGDMEKAIENLRKAGITKAAKKAGRTAKEGHVVVCVQGQTAGMAEILVETDFAARNEKFLSFGDAVARRIVTGYTEDGEISAKVAEAEKAALTALIATIGENMQLRRAVRWQGAGPVASYLHMGGKIGVLLEVEGPVENPELLTDVCMHVAAFNPRFIKPENVPASVLASEREIARAQVQGKPEKIIEKIVDGKIAKWYTDVCLMLQPWLRDDKTCLAKVAPKLVVRRFLRWQIGEEL